MDEAQGKKNCPKSYHDVPMSKRVGRQNRSLMRLAAWLEVHPFAKTLHQWEKGVPVDCGENWTRETLELALLKGPHSSALTPESVTLISKEVAYQVDAGFSRIITWESIKDKLPPCLKISPIAVVPQLNRRGRLILDLSFPVHCASKKGGGTMGTVVQASVNNTTVPLAPTWPVSELGRVLPRVLDFMKTVPEHEEIQFAKIDLSDGFWRMIVPEADCWNFAYVLPDVPGTPLPRLVIPHALQMGWTQSPGFFSAATETVRDTIQVLLDENRPSLPMTWSIS
jgi:hypothetical protein